MNPYQYNNVPGVNKAPYGSAESDIRQLKVQLEEIEYRLQDLVKYVDDMRDHFHARVTNIENITGSLDIAVGALCGNAKIKAEKKKRWWRRGK